jgi:hypothetical protein
MEATRFYHRPCTQPGPDYRAGNARLRTEAVRQLRWQQRDWTRTLAKHAPGTPCLIPSAARAGLNVGLDLLREAGEDVPSLLYRRGSLVRLSDAGRGTATSVSVAGLLSAITQALAWCDAE